MATRRTTAKARPAPKAKPPARPEARTAARPPSVKAKPRPSTKPKPRPSAKPRAAVTAKRRPTRTKAPARGRSKPAKPAKQATTARFDGERLTGLLPHARRGDLHAILGIAPDCEIRAALATPPDWGTGSYERLLALHLAGDAFGHPNVDGVIYDFAEHTYFRYDDEGYALSQLNADLGAIHAVDHWGVFDEAKAESYFRSALGGPYPEGVLEDLDAVLAGSTRPLPLLSALRARPETDQPARRIGSLDGGDDDDDDDSFNDG